MEVGQVARLQLLRAARERRRPGPLVLLQGRRQQRMGEVQGGVGMEGVVLVAWGERKLAGTARSASG